MTTTHYVPTSHIEGDRFQLPTEEAYHAHRVLRQREGSEIFLVDGVGGWYRGTLTRMTSTEGAGIIQETRRDVGELVVDLTVGLSPVKQHARFETFVEKAVELGVRKIIPVETRRTERGQLRTDRLEKIMIAAMKQCGRSRLPLLEPITPYTRLLSDSGTEGLKLICHETISAGISLTAALRHAGELKSINVVVGPEGGFDEREIADAQVAGWQPVSLGRRRLRAETAAIAALSVAMSWCEQ